MRKLPSHSTKLHGILFICFLHSNLSQGAGEFFDGWVDRSGCADNEKSTGKNVNVKL
jgi:hypothetical protein